jgi:DNA-binding LytR/AlgR family response regulator
METKTKIQINSATGAHLIDPDKIICIYPEKRKTHVYLDNEVKILANHGIEEMEELLDYPFFFRCHRACMINLLKIEYIVNGYSSLIMQSGLEFPISKHRRKAFKQALSHFCKNTGGGLNN